MNIEEIKILRMKTGENIVGYVTDIDDMKFHIRTPMLIDIQTDNQTMKQMFVIRSWLPHQLIISNETTLWMNDVLFTLEPNEEFIEYYTESVYKLERLLAMKEIMDYLESEDDITEAMNELKSSQVH
jgi:hypothetical protein